MRAKRIEFHFTLSCIVVIACDKREAFAQGSEATKQSIYRLCRAMDCFAEPVIGRAFARPVGSQ